MSLWDLASFKILHLSIGSDFGVDWMFFTFSFTLKPMLGRLVLGVSESGFASLPVRNILLLFPKREILSHPQTCG